MRRTTAKKSEDSLFGVHCDTKRSRNLPALYVSVPQESGKSLAVTGGSPGRLIIG